MALVMNGCVPTAVTDEAATIGDSFKEEVLDWRAEEFISAFLAEEGDASTVSLVLLDPYAAWTGSPSRNV